MPPKPTAAATTASDEVESQFERLNIGAGAASSAAAGPLAPVAAAAAATVTQASAAASSTPVTVSAEDQRLITGCVNVMLALIDKLQSESSEPLLAASVAMDNSRLSDYADTLSHHVTKFVLFTSQGEVGVLSSAAEELSNHLTGVSCLLRTMLAPSVAPSAGEAEAALAQGTVTAGPTQRAQILAVHSSILAGVRAIIVQLSSHLLARKSVPLDARLTGQVWQTLEKSLKSLPLTNAHAVGKLVLQQCGVIKDAKEELARLHIGPPKSAKDEDDDDGEDDEDDDDFGDEDDDEADRNLTPSEFAIVPGCSALVNASQQLVKAVYGYILKSKLSESRQDNVDWLEGRLAAVRKTCQQVDELVETLYAPQDRSLALAAAENLTQQLLEAARELVKQHRATPGATWPLSIPSSSPVASASSAASAAAQADEASPIPADEATLWLRKVESHIQQCQDDITAAAAAPAS